MMNIKEKTIQMCREKIMDHGFMSAAQLIPDMFEFLRNEREGNLTASEIENWLEEIPNEFIHSVEYTNSEVADFRVKDLFFYNPNEEIRCCVNETKGIMAIILGRVTL